MCFFFFKQKTAYEMRISDWSSDVCSSDLSRFIDVSAKEGAAPFSGAGFGLRADVGYQNMGASRAEALSDSSPNARSTASHDGCFPNQIEHQWNSNSPGACRPN